jgi:hypothetical protein
MTRVRALDTNQPDGRVLTRAWSRADINLLAYLLGDDSRQLSLLAHVMVRTDRLSTKSGHRD